MDYKSHRGYGGWGLQDIALSVGFEPVRGCPATFVPQNEGRVAGMMVIHADDGTWAGSGKAFLGAQGIMRKLLKIRKEEFRTLYLLGRQVTSLKDGAIKVGSLKYVSALKPVHVPAARRKNSSQRLVGKEMTQYRSLVQQLAWPTRTMLPSIAYKVSDLRQRTSEATVPDLVRAKFVLRAAQEKTRQGHGPRFRKIDGKLAWSPSSTPSRTSCRSMAIRLSLVDEPVFTVVSYCDRQSVPGP